MPGLGEQDGLFLGGPENYPSPSEIAELVVHKLILISGTAFGLTILYKVYRERRERGGAAPHEPGPGLGERAGHLLSWAPRKLARAFAAGWEQVFRNPEDYAGNNSRKVESFRGAHRSGIGSGEICLINYKDGIGNINCWVISASSKVLDRVAGDDRDLRILDIRYMPKKEAAEFIANNGVSNFRVFIARGSCHGLQLITFEDKHYESILGGKPVKGEDPAAQGSGFEPPVSSANLNDSSRYTGGLRSSGGRPVVADANVAPSREGSHHRR